VIAAEYDALTAGSGYSEQWNMSVSGTKTNGAGGTTNCGAATVTMSWDLVADATPNNHWAIGGVSIKPSATGGTGTITFDSSSSGAVQNTNSLTFSHSIGGSANRILIVTVSIENCGSTPTVTGITYNGKALTHAVSVDLTSGNDCRGRSELWYLLESDLPSAGSYDVVVTASASTEEIIAGAISLNDVAQQAPEASSTSSNESTDAISVNITTLTDGSWLVDSVHSGNSGSYTPDAGQTERYDLQGVGTTSTHAASTKEVTTAGSTTMGETYASGANRQTYVAAAFATTTLAESCTPITDAVVTLELTLSSSEGGSVSMRTKVYLRNLP